MEKKYQKLFDEFEKAPLEAFLESVLEEVKEEQQKLLVLEDVSYHRLNYSGSNDVSGSYRDQQMHLGNNGASRLNRTGKKALLYKRP